MSIFPFLIPPSPAEAATSMLPEYKEVAYDYQNNCLLTRGGKYYLVSKNEALKIWIYKVLLSKRYMYQAYSGDYGTEHDNVIGLTKDKGILESEIKRYITEAIMVNPYIQELSDFEYQWEDGCKVSFVVTSIYDKFTWQSEVYVT